MTLRALEANRVINSIGVVQGRGAVIDQLCRLVETFKAERDQFQASLEFLMEEEAI